MRGSLRVHTLRGLVLLVGWCLLSQARERVAPSRIPPAAPRTRAPARANSGPARWWSIPARGPRRIITANSKRFSTLSRGVRACAGAIVLSSQKKPVPATSSMCRLTSLTRK